MSTYFGYIRVSTARQGERGVSLQEQRDAISGYAERHQLEISRRFEERETPAKRVHLSADIQAVVAALCNTFLLHRRTPARYGGGYATDRRGHPGVPGNLEANIQGRHRDWRRATLRLAAHRAVHPTCETSAVGEEVLCTA